MSLTVYWSLPGFEKELRFELGHSQPSRKGALPPEIEVWGDDVAFASPAPIEGREPIWVADVWYECEALEIPSISQAASMLRQRGARWYPRFFEKQRRTALIQEQLPRIGGGPVNFLSPLPVTDFGVWTLKSDHELICSRLSRSRAPNGEIEFVEASQAPSRAYLKLWELFTVHRFFPPADAVCLDLGSCPGGWTWVLSEMGREVISVDRSPLAPVLHNRKNVRFRSGNAFALQPHDFPEVKWLFSDLICFPEKLLQLVENWILKGNCDSMACTIKFRGETDFATLEKFRAIPGSQTMHLHHNRHELTWIWRRDGTTPSPWRTAYSNKS
jgi:23S rRNA (cytidine2498-2'-O)-methyltransferase